MTQHPTTQHQWFGRAIAIGLIWLAPQLLHAQAADPCAANKITITSVGDFNDFEEGACTDAGVIKRQNEGKKTVDDEILSACLGFCKRQRANAFGDTSVCDRDRVLPLSNIFDPHPATLDGRQFCFWTVRVDFPQCTCRDSEQYD